MGLTIHYTLCTDSCDAQSARRLVTRLRGRAMDLPFADVQPLVEYTAPRRSAVRAKEIGEWNEMIASFAGALKDILANGALQAPILGFTNFERLEAKGRNRKKTN